MIHYSSKIKTAFFVFFTVSIPLLSFSQKPDSLLKKFSFPVRAMKKEDEKKAFDYVIVANDQNSFRSFLVKQPGIFTKREYAGAGIWVISATLKQIREQILVRPDVIFIDRQRVPVEEVAVSNLDISADKLNMVHRWYPLIDGQALTVSVKEHRPDTLDIDLKGRYIHSPLASSQLSGHATIMSTIIAGAGNTFYEGRGAAKAVSVTSFSFMNLLPEPDATYQQYNVSVQNHSYGTAIENYYGAEAVAYDASVITRPALVHVFSAGNSGTQTSTNGPYANVNGFANLTGNFKMAKNIITVGHVDSMGNVLPASSRGPAHDGKVKPELVAFGEDGSSGAAAIVSGTALLVQQAYRDQQGSLPATSLVKAILLNTADDVGNAGIDFTSGYGELNAFKAIQSTVNGHYFSGTVATGSQNDHLLLVSPNSSRLKITLAWTDPPAMANALNTLKNDLDLELIQPATSQSWHPWVLSHFPHSDSLSKLPERERDSLNVVEQITLDNPAASNYILRVKGFNVPTSPQAYSIAYQIDTAQHFRWYYPTRIDNLFAGRQNILRWTNTFNNTGNLEWSVDGTNWQLIVSNIDLARGYYKWTPPINFQNVFLRMNVASQSFVTDTISVSGRMPLNIGFNCPDSFALWWNRIAGINSYQLYRLGNLYMEPFLQTSDTLVVLDKQSSPSLYYAVSPVINNKTGLRSYAYNYTMQGVECYIRSFFAVLNNNVVELTLELGSHYNVRKIVWEKLTATGYRSLGEISPVQSVVLNHLDNSLEKGLNVYRVKIELVNGQVIFSQPETVYYFVNDIYLFYPNPVRRGETLNLANRDAGLVGVQIINISGAKVFEMEQIGQTIAIPTTKFSPGIYFVYIIKEGKTDEIMKLLVL